MYMCGCVFMCWSGFVFHLELFFSVCNGLCVLRFCVCVCVCLVMLFVYLSYTRCSCKNLEVTLLFVDFSKALDSMQMEDGANTMSQP